MVNWTSVRAKAIRVVYRDRKGDLPIRTAASCVPWVNVRSSAGRLDFQIQSRVRPNGPTDDSRTS